MAGRVTRPAPNIPHPGPGTACSTPRAQGIEDGWMDGLIRPAREASGDQDSNSAGHGNFLFYL